MRFNIVSFYRLLLLCVLLLILAIPSNAKKKSLINEDSLAIERWVSPIRESIYNNPEVIAPWLDSLSDYADSTQNPYVNYIKNNIKGNYNWAIRRFDTAVNYYMIAEQWAVAGGLVKQQISVNGNLGLIYSFLDNFDSSTFYYQKTIDMARKYNYNELYVRNILNLSYVYNQKGDYAEAVELLEEARIKMEQIDDEELKIMLYSALGSIYYYLGDIEQMKFNYQLAINHYLKSNNKSVLATLYSNIAESYSSVIHNYDSSAYYFDKALEVSIPQNKDDVLHLIDITRGSLFYDSENYDSAAFYYQRAIHNPLSDVYARRKAALLVNMGNVYLAKNMFNKAIDYYNKGYQLSDSLELIEYKANAVLGLIRVDSIRGNFEQAFFRNFELQQIKSNLKKTEIHNQLMASETERALEIQSLQNVLLEKENDYQEDMIKNQRWIGLLIIWALLGSLVFILVQFLNYRKIHNLNRLLNVNIKRLDVQNEELVRLNKTKDKFFSIISHDLRGPFSAQRTGTIMLNTEWDELTEEERKELVRQLDNSTENTNNLLEELLQWSQLQQGFMKMKQHNFPVVKLINDLNNLFSNVLKQKEQRLVIDIDENVHLNTDYQMLKQVLHNLLNNAIKFTLRGGEIRLELMNLPETINITVRDNGIGIPKEKQAGIFELDCDFGRPGTEGEKSSGMGLILCMDYANLLGAKLELESEEGQGSAFTVAFRK